MAITWVNDTLGGGTMDYACQDGVRVCFVHDVPAGWSVRWMDLEHEAPGAHVVYPTSRQAYDAICARIASDPDIGKRIAERRAGRRKA